MSGFVYTETPKTIGLAGGTASVGSVDINPGQTVGLNEGHNFIGFAQLTDKETGTNSHIDIYNAIRVHSDIKLNGSQFTGTTKDTNFWTETVTGTGSVTQATGNITLATGATANSTARYQTVRSARFITGHVNVFRCGLKLSNTGTADNIRRWGNFDTNNGVFFQLNGTTMQIGTRAAASDTYVNKADWNVSTAFTVDTNYHIYEIHETMHRSEFYIDNNLVHIVSIAGSSTLPYQTLSLPVTAENINSNGQTANVSLIASFLMTYRLGELSSENIYKNIVGAGTTILKYGVGRLHKVVVNAAAGTSLAVYDNTAGSGTLIATISLGATAAPTSLEYNCPFNVGLTVVSVGAGVNMTIIYE